MSQLRFIRKVLYQLKRRYGNPVNLIKIVSETDNLETGARTQVKENLLVDRAIILPSTIKREVFYDRAYLTGNKEFTYGASNDTDTRTFIFDRDDLGSWIITIGQILIYSGKRYDVREVQEFEENTGYVVLAKESENVPLGNVISISIFDDLLLDDEAVAVKA